MRHIHVNSKKNGPNIQKYTVHQMRCLPSDHQVFDSTASLISNMSRPQDVLLLMRDKYPQRAFSDDERLNDQCRVLSDCIHRMIAQTDMSQSQSRMEILLKDAHAAMADTQVDSKDRAKFRQVHTDTCICIALNVILSQVKMREDERWIQCIRRLDEAIVYSGAPNRMDIIQDMITYIQQTYLPSIQDVDLQEESHPISSQSLQLPAYGKEIPEMQEPDLMAFLATHSKSPFVIRGAILHWPALTDHPWSSQSYLLSVAGRGRIVPVEIGRDYRRDDWGQEMMPWEIFINRVNSAEEPLVYLAQHSLLSQFPKLAEDISVPDLVYYEPSSEHPAYKRPQNEEGLIMNAWFGPKGTISPAHQDPYFNCYAQVVGTKTVWLAPPHLKEEMYPLGSGSGLSNTSSVDVFTPDKEKHPLFIQGAIDHSMAVTLQPGDLLFFPPGWWHAMRSETKSFSVSFWF
ncbi:Clavaminate synthase-like protein [Serendipita vermifera]|nr:Clavaminate synthase-like protein [Serendipita vermifera]